MGEILTETIAIPLYKRTYLNMSIEKLNRRAKKLNCMPILLKYDNPHTLEYQVDPWTGADLMTPLVVEMVDATITYEIPIIPGYSFVASLDMFQDEDGSSEVLVSSVPGKKVPEFYMLTDEIGCDHCGYRRRRNSSFLLHKAETDEYKEVGSTCIKDFMGHDPRGFLLFAAIKFGDIVSALYDDEDQPGLGERGTAAFKLEGFLAMTCAVVERFGWMSKGRAYEEDLTSTCEIVLENFNSDDLITPEIKVHVSDFNTERAGKVAEYFEDLDAGDNDYLVNCQKIANLGYVPLKYAGYASSMVAGYERHLRELVELENELPSEHVGEVKERLKDISVTCLFSKVFDSDWGTSTLYMFQDESGNIFKTFYSGCSWEAYIGGIYLLTGTVKRHGEYKGKKETMLSRCAVKELQEAIA